MAFAPAVAPAAQAPARAAAGSAPAASSDAAALPDPTAAGPADAVPSLTAAPATWEIQPSPNPPGAVSASLAGVACAADGTCMPVGSYSPGGSSHLTLAERWDGIAWSVVSTPNPSGASGFSRASRAQ